MKRAIKLIPLLIAVIALFSLLALSASAEGGESVFVGFYDEAGNLIHTEEAAPGDTVSLPEGARAEYVRGWLDYIPKEWNESLTVPEGVSEYRITEKVGGEKEIVAAVDMLFSPNLTSHFQYNLFVPRPQEGIAVTKVVLADDRTANYNSNLSKLYSINGELYNMTSIWPGMIRAANEKTVASVTFTYGGATYTSSGTVNIKDYCNYVLDNDYGERAKVLAVNVANYVHKGAILLGSTYAEGAMAEIVEENSDRIIHPTLSDLVRTDKSALAPYVKSVQLVAAVYGPKFRFNLTDAGKAATVTLSTGGSANYATLGYIETNNTYVSMINSTVIKVTSASGDVVSFEYTLANYITDICLDYYYRVDSSSAATYDFLAAMYGYARANYKAPESGHNLVSTVIPATCESKGYTVYSCTDEGCSYFYTDNYTDSFGKSHELVNYDGKEPTCEERGYAAYTECKNCSYTNKVEVGGGHNYEVSSVLAPTCTEEGYTLYTCSLCSGSYKDNVLAPTGHTMGNYYISEPVSMTSDGVMRSSCLNCAHYETKQIPIISSGNFGKGTSATSAVTYTLFEEGTLKISGTGATFGCGWNGANQPFKAYRESVKRLIICEGVTGTTGGDFVGLVNLEAVEFPESFTSIGTNAFMDSFKKGITSLTIPKQITYIGTYAFGVYSMDTAVFTEITVENPNLEFYSASAANIPRIFNRGNYNTQITFYSYGASTTTSAYANTIGASYVNLNDSVSGEVDNLKYEFFSGKLTLSPVDNTAAAVLPESAPWLDKISKADVTSIVIEEGISAIPASYFADYTSLTSVKIADGLLSVGSNAFGCSGACSVNLSVSFPKSVCEIGEGIFKNRTNVSLSAFSGGVMDSFEEEGVTLNTKKSFRLLMIGNSLSMDGADCTSGGTTSRLYDIIKGMLGEGASVEIGVLYSGARTCTWHATMARDNVAAYQFMVISEETGGLWKVVSNAYTSKAGLLYADWDYVTLQPYGNETLTGIDDTTTGISNSYKDQYFGSLDVSLPYLLDFIYDSAPEAEAYYYLTWASSNSAYMNTGASKFEGMVDVAITASQYSGANKAFSGIIAAGTSIQNARSTYLALLNYTDSSSLDVQKNLQRDAVHLSRSVGRYIAALTIAETLVPEAMREVNYEIPDIKPSAVIGNLPAEYTEIAKLAVANALLSYEKTGADKYKPIAISGYATDPADSAKAKIEAVSLSSVSASSESELEEALLSAFTAAVANSDVKIAVDVTNHNTSTGAFTASVKVTFGYTERSITVTK